MIVYKYKEQTINYLEGVRKWFPNKSLPENITEDVLSSLGVLIEKEPEKDEVWNGTEYIIPLSVLKEYKKAEIAQSRFEAETAGIYGIKTDRESQGILTGAVLQAVIYPTYSLEWKTIDGTFVTLSAEEIMTVGRTVREYVQAQFNKEAKLCDMINSSETTEEVKKITWGAF